MSNTRMISAMVATASMALGFAQAVHAKNPVPGKPGTQNIVQIAAAVNAQTGEFDYLLAAATCDYFDGAIVELLTGSDQLTLFAPTDAAFEALQRKLGVTTPAPSVTCSLPQATVFNVLAYHVTDGRRFSNSVFNKRSTTECQCRTDRARRSHPRAGDPDERLLHQPARHGRRVASVVDRRRLRRPGSCLRPGQMDGCPGRSGLRFELRAPGARRGLCL